MNDCRTQRGAQGGGCALKAQGTRARPEPSQPRIDYLSTSHRPRIDLASTSHRPRIALGSTSNLPRSTVDLMCVRRAPSAPACGFRPCARGKSSVFIGDLRGFRYKIMGKRVPYLLIRRKGGRIVQKVPSNSFKTCSSFIPRVTSGFMAR